MVNLIIGASSDIGFRTAELLKNDGKEIFVTARNIDRLEELKKNFNCEGEVLDATDFSRTEEVFKNCLEKFGEIESALCFAGSLNLKPAHLTSFDDFMQVLNSSLVCAFSTVRASGKYMRNGGSVVLFSSAAAKVGLANHEAIAAAKGGVEALARSAAATYASQNLRFNVVAPGLTDTKLTAKITSNEMSLKFSKAMHALGKIGEVNDIAEMVRFLADDKAKFITGQTFYVDGGLSCIQPKQVAR